jgi:hypothetical protein
MADILNNEHEVLATPETEVKERPQMFDFYTPPEKEVEQPSFFSNLKRASEETNLLTRGLISMYEGQKDFPIDYDFNYDEHKAELNKDVPQEYWYELAKADSLAEAQNTKWRIEDELDGKRQVAAAGYEGVAAQLITGILSPENIVPLGALYGWADKGARLTSAIKTGLVTAATAGAAESLIYSGMKTKDAEDILYATTFGFTLGGAFGAVLSKSPVTRLDVPEVPRMSPTVKAGEAPTVRDGETPDPFVAVGPPKPKVISKEIESAIVRREGPIDIDTHVKVNSLHDRLRNIDITTASKKVKQSIAKDFSNIDHRASLDSDTASKLDAIYEQVGYTPTDKSIVTETVAGSWKSLEEDMAYASRELRAEMDIKIADDFVVPDGNDDAGAMRNREVDHQIIETSGREDDVIDTSNDWAADNQIQKQLDDSGTHTAAVRSKILSSDYTRLIDSPSNVVKKIAFDLLEGGTGSVKGQGKTAAQYLDVYSRRILSRGVVPLNENYSLWAKGKNLNFMQRNFWKEGYDSFYGEVRDVLEHRVIGKDVRDIDPHVLAAADAWDDMMTTALKIAKESGVESMQEISERAGYVPLHWNGKNMLSAFAKHGRKNVKALITDSYKSVGLDEDMAQEIADAVIKRALDKRAGVDADISGLLKKNQRDQLASQLNRMGLSDTTISAFIRKLDSREAKAGPGFTKSRTRIDMTMNRNGIRMTDLVDNDLNTLASSYVREIAGRSALAKKGITSEGKWNALKSAALKDNARVKSLDAKGDDKLGEHLDDVRSYFSAYPIAGGVAANARRLQQLATVSSLGMVGAAQLAELGTIVGRMGIKAAAKSMPSVKELFTLAKTVKKGKDPIIDELRPLLGDFDYDHLLYRPDIILDDKITDAVDSSTWAQVIDKGLGKANTALGYASGMNSVRHFEHQLAAKMIVNKFADLAVNPDKVAKSLARLEDINVDAKDLAKITKEINKYAEFDNGTLKKMNLDKWNPETAETFAYAINKHTAQVVQRQLAGETSNWMHKTIGSLLTQFRHFPIVAYEKQLLRNIRHHDQAFLTTMLYGFGVSYAIQAVRAGLAGEDINSPDTFKKTINYMGMATVAPDILTVAAQLNLVPEALNFRKMGHTGARADSFDLIDWIPAAGQVNKMFKLGAIPGKALQGDLSNSDIRAGAMALPFATVGPVKTLLQVLLED